MCKGGQNTTTSTSAPNPVAGAAYTNLLNQAQGTAATPYAPYTGELVAPNNTQQNTGIAGINANANYAQPFMQKALDYGVIGATPLTAAQIQQYSSPYTQSVVDATQNQFNNQNAIQQQGVISNAVASGAFGGNRTPVAQAVLAGQQQTAQAPVIAGLENQGYTTGLNTALTEQQAAAQGAYSLGNLGVAGQNAALTGANAQVGAGTLQQSTQQAQDQALYQQYINQMAYPFQTEQWLAGIDTGVGSNLGGTSATTGPPPNQTAQDLGLGIAGIGAAGSLASGLGGSAGLLAALPLLKDGGVASKRTRTIPETEDTLHAQQHQLLRGHRRAQLFPNGTKELPLPRGMKKVETDAGVFHYDPSRIDAEEIKHHSKNGRENELLDLGPFSKEEVQHRVKRGEAPLTVVERDHAGTEVRAAGGTVSTVHHQIAAMDRTKSPGHTLTIEHPHAVLGARLRRAMGGHIPSRATGGANYSTFGGGFGTSVMPYSGGNSYVPSIGITHGQLPQTPRGGSQQPSVSDQMKQISDLAGMFNNKNNNNNNGIAPPRNLTPQYSTPVGSVMPIGTSPEAYSPTDYSGSTGQIYARGGSVHGYADGGGDDDFGAPSSGVLPVTPSPPTQAFSQPSAPPPAPINIRQRIIDEANSAGIDPSFALKQAGQESGMRQYDPEGGVVTSPKGAMGVGQLMPGTAKDLGVDPTDPSQNVHGMIAYDKQLYDKYGGNYDDVAAAYNAGPTRYDAVLRGERPLPAETAKYVSGITGRAPALHNSPIGWSDNSSPRPSPGATSQQSDSGVAPSGGGFFDKTHNLWPAMMAAGLGMMASRSPFLGNAIGEGGLSGMQVYSNEVSQEHANATKQQEIDQAARKLDMEMNHQQSTLDLETRKANEIERNNAAKLAEETRNHTLERNKPIITFNRDGSQNLISPITGLPINQGPQAPPPPPTPGQAAPQSSLHSGGDYTMSQPPNSGFQPPPQQQQQGAARPAVFQPVAEKDNIPAGLQPPSVFRDEDYLKTLPPDDIPLVKGLSEYQLSPTSFSMRSPHPGVPSERERLVSEASRYTTDPKTGTADYDQTLYPAKQKAVNDFLSGTSPQSSATVMTAGNTAILHASELYDLVDKIKNLPPEQQSWFSKAMDSISSGATAAGIPYATYAAQQIKNSGLAGTPEGEMLARWADAKQRYSEEVTRFYSGGNGSEAERERSISLLDPSKSAAELKGSIAQDMTMLRDKVETYNHRLMAGMGPSAWRTALRQDPSLVTVYNSSRNVLDRIGASEQQRSSGSGQVTPPSANHPAPADRFKQLRGSGMSAQDAYAQMHKEGYQ